MFVSATLIIHIILSMPLHSCCFRVLLPRLVGMQPSNVFAHLVKLIPRMVCVCACVDVRMYVCILVSGFVLLYVCMCVCVRVRVCSFEGILALFSARGMHERYTGDGEADELMANYATHGAAVTNKKLAKLEKEYMVQQEQEAKQKAEVEVRCVVAWRMGRIACGLRRTEYQRLAIKLHTFVAGVRILMSDPCTDAAAAVIDYV